MSKLLYLNLQIFQKLHSVKGRVLSLQPSDLFPFFLGEKEETEFEKITKPSFMDRSGYVKTRWETDDGDPVYWYLDLPTEDLRRLGRVKEFLGGLSPVYTMVNILNNVRTWPHGGELSHPGQISRAPFWVEWLPEWAQRWADIQPMRERDGTVTLGMNPQWKYAFKTAFPFLNDWERAHPGTGSLSTREEKDRKWGIISWATGMKWRPVIKEDAALSAQYRILEGIKNMRRAAKRRPTATVEDLKEVFQKTLRE